ncbi:facilitated trehalose transporter Tret1-like [Trichoplusia ni]|uniref:Facilitated trehalose transporter Tret1-like n=1 Tax=Trichoplusia ni TaxID=7111 RepID=A0A7E5WY53_TRINI|nr:facilitated trehalose transporter Tret1-like [Trichoplusia ni]
MSPVTKLLQSEQSPAGRPLSDSEISWIASAPSLAGMVGVLFFVPLVERYGRKPGILIMLALQVLTWVFKMFPSSMTCLIIGRVACGMAGGGCFHVVPMYIKEFAQDSIRGTLLSIFVIAQSMGILIIYALGGYLDYYTVLWVVIGLPILGFGLFLKAPESPAHLVKVGKIEEAASTLSFLRGIEVEDKEIQNEVNAIKKDDDYFKSIPDVSLITIFTTKAWRKAFVIMILIILAGATSGGFTILNYAATILSTSGVGLSPELQSLSIPIFMTIGSLFTFATVDKLGRKPILLMAYLASALAFACLATTGLLQVHGWVTPGWLNVLMLAIVICCYGGGITPVPFIVMPELFNFQIRGKLMGYLVMLAWFMAFIQLLAFSAITSSYGAHMSFYMFTVINFLGVVITLVLLPETNGKSVEELERKLNGDDVRASEKCEDS